MECFGQEVHVSFPDEQAGTLHGSFLPTVYECVRKQVNVTSAAKRFE